jgi:aspartate aminotransferase-like enzyme
VNIRSLQTILVIICRSLRERERKSNFKRQTDRTVNEIVPSPSCVVGHAAMEAACTNLLEPGETVLVCENGLWGQRFADMCTRNGQ